MYIALLDTMCQIIIMCLGLFILFNKGSVLSRPKPARVSGLFVHFIFVTGLGQCSRAWLPWLYNLT